MNNFSDIKNIIHKLKKSCREISNLLRKHIPIKESTGIVNSSKDKVNKIDLISNEILKKNLSKCKEIFCIGSEEEENLVYVNKSGKYFVAFDPLDGSKNIDINLPTGTIFVIYDLSEKGIMKLLNFEDIIYSGYCLYSSATILVETKSKTEMSILKNGTFKNIKRNLRMPKKGTTYSINSGNKKNWNQNTKEIIDKINEQNLSLRYDGCLVADIHRILLNGGIFMYPKDKKNVNGKLRLIYEVWPIAHVCSNSGAYFYGGYEGVNDLTKLKFPENIHQKVNFIVCGEIENYTYGEMFKIQSNL